MKVTNLRAYHGSVTCFIQGVSEQENEITVDPRDAFVKPEDKRHEKDKREDTYVKPGHLLKLKKGNLVENYSELLTLGAKVFMRLSFWTDGEKKFVKILTVKIEHKENGKTVIKNLLRKGQYQYAETDSLPHQAVRTICHSFMKLDMPEDEPSTPPQGPSIH